MDSYLYIGIAGVAGILFGMIIGRLLFSKKSELQMLQKEFRQERLRNETRISKVEGDLSQVNSNLKHSSYFISVLPQLYNKLREQETPQGIANVLLVFVEKFFEARQITFFIYNPGRNVLEMLAKKGLPDQIPLGYSINVGEGKIGWAAQKRMIMNEKDFETETYMVRQQLEKTTTAYFKVELCAPVTYYEELLGIISLGNMIKRYRIEKVMIQMIVETAAPFLKTAIEKVLSKQPDQREVPQHATDKLVDKSMYITRLDQRVEESRMMAGSMLVVAFIEIDDYHLYVQKYGIASGENALTLISKLILSTLDKAEIKARFEEALFCVLFANQSINDVYNLVDSLRQKISLYQFPVDTPRETGHLTVSCGLSVFPYNADTMDTLMSFANQAVRSAHSAGGDKIMPTLPDLLGSKSPTDFLDVDIMNAFEE